MTYGTTVAHRRMRASLIETPDRTFHDRPESPPKGQFHSDDALLLNNQLTDDERMVRDAAAYCQYKLKSRLACRAACGWAA
jgi:hypothetical protein